jgi:outer membrane protein OmpA-like peptidoglycan-associated protein
MKLRLAAASVMVLGLFAGAPGALAEGTAAPIVVVQAEIPQEVQALLQDTRDPASLTQEELNARFRQARNLAKINTLDDDTRKQLQAIGNAARQESVRRQSEAAQQKPEAQPEQKAEEPQQQPEQPAKPAVPAAVKRILADDRPAKDLGNEELIQRYRQARSFAGQEALPADVRKSLADMARADRAEVVARQKAAENPAEPESGQEAKQSGEKNQAQDSGKAAAMPDDLRKLLADKRGAKEVSVEELRDRFRTARKYNQNESLPADLRARLTKIAADSRAEVLRREAEAQGEQPQAEGQQPPQQASSAAEVRALLADNRPIGDYSVEELRNRFRVARKYNENKTLPADMRAKLTKIAGDARGEILRRQAQAGQPQETPPDVSSAAELRALLADNRPIGKYSVEELRDRFRIARKYNENQKLPADMRTKLTKIAADARQEVLRRQAQGQPQPQPGKPNAEQAEAQAREILNDPNPATKLNDAMLRKRLYAMRDLLALNLVTAQTEDALRKKLAADREVFRQRVAERQGAAPLPAAPPKPGSGSTTVNNNVNITNVQVILNDRRRSDELDDEELRRRIAVYRDAYRDDRYEEDDRDFYEETLERDRELLRRRLIDERRRRAAQLEVKGKNFNIDIGLEFEPSAPKRPRYVFAQEADDEELEDILAAPPARKIQRKYSIDDIESEPELREAMPAIEIDNVRFGFNESFVREEEVGNLDRIAEIMEKIIATRPSEIFMIEGHTDAVGGDDYNLKLSRERAAAIKKALTTYYVIPERNLKTVGYGERYLKIPTPEAEQENRRVSVRRVTPLLGLND